MIIGEWSVTDEFNQRVGCGLVTALTLPLWFLLLGLAVSSNLALMVAVGLFALSLVVGPMVLGRSRRLPRKVRIELPAGTDGGPLTSAVLVAVSPSGERRRLLAELRRLDVGASVGPWPIRLAFADGSHLRLPADIEHLDTLLDELRRRCPLLTLTGLDRLHHEDGSGDHEETAR